MTLFRRLAKPFLRPHPVTRCLEVAGGTLGVLLKNVEQGRASGAVTEKAVPLYRCLIVGARTIYGLIGSTQPFSDQLWRLGFAGKDSALAGYYWLVAQRFWEVNQAFLSDPAISQHIGLDFPAFVEEFCDVTGFPRPLIDDLLSSADRICTELGGVVDDRPVIDRQTFDFLQTITNGRYTAEHWNSIGLGLLGPCAEVQMARLMQLKIAKEQMGLAGPVLGITTQSS